LIRKLAHFPLQDIDESSNKVPDESKRISHVPVRASVPTPDVTVDDANGVTSVYDTAKSTGEEDLYQVPGSNKEVELPEGVDYAVSI
jgi:hypothetical protein